MDSLLERPVTVGLMCMLLPLPASGQDARALMDSLRYLDPAVRPAAQKTSDACRIAGDSAWNLLKALVDEEAFQKKLRGTARATLTGDEAVGGQSGRETVTSPSDREFFKLATALEMSQGDYPGEFKFHAAVGVTLDDDEFRENVSSLHLAFDRYANEWLEGYVFVDRRTDDFMSLDQRYEAGGGIVAAWTVGTTGKGEKAVEKLTFDPLPPSARADDEERAKAAVAEMAELPWVTCLRNVGAATSGDSKSDAAAQVAANERLLKLAKRADELRATARTAAENRYAILRLGLLVGVFAELEKATILESVIRRSAEGDETVTPASFSLPGHQRFRFSLRPTIMEDVRRLVPASSPLLQAAGPRFVATAADR